MKQNDEENHDIARHPSGPSPLVSRMVFNACGMFVDECNLEQQWIPTSSPHFLPRVQLRRITPDLPQDQSDSSVGATLVSPTCVEILKLHNPRYILQMFAISPKGSQPHSPKARSNLNDDQPPTLPFVMGISRAGWGPCILPVLKGRNYLYAPKPPSRRQVMKDMPNAPDPLRSLPYFRWHYSVPEGGSGFMRTYSDEEEGDW